MTIPSLYSAVTHKITKLANNRRRNKVGFDHIALKQTIDSFCVFPVGFVFLLRFRVLRHGLAGLLKDIENGNPIFTGGIHANVLTVIFGEPIRQILQAVGI